VKLLRQKRAGKTAALNRGVREAGGEILVFSDANSIYDRWALTNLMANFSDPEVGYVTGKMIYVDTDGSPIGDGCTSYMKYENLLRSLETKIGSIVGVNGGIDAVRKSLFSPMREDHLPDFILPLGVVEKGFRVVYEPRAVLKENTLKNGGDEYRMRVRVSLRAIWALADMRQLLDIRRFPLFSWEMISHKVLRYFAFLFLLSLFFLNTFLFFSGISFALFFLFQCLCYVAAALSFFLDTKGRRIRAFYIPYYFTLLNMAAANAFLKFLAGHRQVTWTPRKGS
jgi:cellulose synthase/poly-beta-1,6-N-acetylglucosamine synthase-like glycosyltransferase